MLPISVCRFARRRSCPGVSPQRFDSPWYARLFIGESWHTSPGDYIPAGRLFSCQGASPLTCSDWGGCFGGYFSKKLLSLHLFGLGNLFFSGVLLKLLPLLVPLGDTFCSGAFQRFLRENEKATHRLGTWLKLPDRQKSDFISENHQIRLKIGENSAIISLSFYIL